MGGLHLQLLGGFEVRLGLGKLVALPAKKSRALLAYLALRPREAHTRDKLASLLWSDTPDEQARQSLRKTLSNLRRELAGARPLPLRTNADTVTLDLDERDVDVLSFERLVAARTPPALATASTLYRGDLLEGFHANEAAFEDWLRGERERLRAMAAEALETLLGHQAAREPDRAIATGTRLLRLNPLHEVAHRTLMRLYARQGRRDTALKQYRGFADLLWGELKVRPEAETEAVYREILADPAPERVGRPTVLVVEDDVVTRTRLEGLLADAGYQVMVAEDGADALLRLSARPFDLILSDIRMPLLDGLKLLEVVREKRIASPVVLLTGYPEGTVEVQALERGAADYITKPIERDALLLRVRNALDRAGRRLPQ